MAAGAAAVSLVAALSACGFNYPTDRINNITAGTNYRAGTVDVLNAAIVSQKDNAGAFVATFVNNSTTTEVSLSSMVGDGTAIGQVAFEPFPIAPGGLVNLADQGGLPVQGTFAPGQFVALTLTFDDGEVAKLSVPVVSQSDNAWSGVTPATPSPSSSPSSTESPSASPS
jgi:hypothetical protein